MGKYWREWQKEKQRLAKERKAKKQRPWVSPEQWYGEDEYKNILFFTQGREAVEEYERSKNA